MRSKDSDEKQRGTGERGAGTLVRIFNKVKRSAKIKAREQER